MNTMFVTILGCGMLASFTCFRSTGRALPQASEQSSPTAVIQAFFRALSRDDVETMALLASLERRRDVQDPRWRALFRGLSLKSIGEIGDGEAGEASHTLRARVPLIYVGSDGSEIQETVRVLRTAGLWYWDER